MRALLLIVGIGVAAVVLISTFVDEGEVVTLVTRDANGADYETPLWVVDLDGQRYLRVGGPGAAWVARVRANPAARLRPAGAEEGEEVAVLAVPAEDPATREAVNRLMAEKYGWADRLWSHILDRGKSVPIRLDAPPAP